MAEAKQKLAELEGKQQQGSSSSGGGGGQLSARAPRPTPRSSRGASRAGTQLPPIPPVPAGGVTSLVHSPRSHRATSTTAAAADHQPKGGSNSSCSSRSSGLCVVANEGSVDEDDDPEGMLQVGGRGNR